MSWVYIVISLIALVLMFILFCGINVSFFVKYADKQFDFGLRVYVLNRIFGKDIKLPKKEDNSTDKPECEDENPEGEDLSSTENAGDKTIKDFVSDLKHTFRKYLDYKDAFMMTAKKMRRKFVFKKLYLTVNYGDGDACSTAVASGSMWGLIYNILGFITNISTVRNHRETVIPEYNKKVFCINAEGIFTLRLVHIICGFILYKINYKKYVKKINL